MHSLRHRCVKYDRANCHPKSDSPLIKKTGSHMRTPLHVRLKVISANEINEEGVTLFRRPNRMPQSVSLVLYTFEFHTEAWINASLHDCRASALLSQEEKLSSWWDWASLSSSSSWLSVRVAVNLSYLPHCLFIVSLVWIETWMKEMKARIEILGRLLCLFSLSL